MDNEAVLNLNYPVEWMCGRKTGFLLFKVSRLGDLDDLSVLRWGPAGQPQNHLCFY